MNQVDRMNYIQLDKLVFGTPDRCGIDGCKRASTKQLKITGGPTVHVCDHHHALAQHTILQDVTVGAVIEK